MRYITHLNTDRTLYESRTMLCCMLARPSQVVRAALCQCRSEHRRDKAEKSVVDSIDLPKGVPPEGRVDFGL